MTDTVFRGRRLRRTPAIRRMVAETQVSAAQLIAPLFIIEGASRKVPIDSMPGHFRLTPDLAAREAADLQALGVGGVILFGIPGSKDAQGSGAWDDNGPVPQAIRRIKQAAPEIVVWADVCLCEYTDHGHCGVLCESGVDNDATLPLLAEAALCYARAGADVIAPSDMMDGRIGAIRTALDRNGFVDRAIVSYAVKYASAFYGPFREAAGSTPKSGDRRAYQMDAPNVREAIREARADISEGADAVMVKPGLPYLDVVRAVHRAVDVPVAVYQVSGEYAMLHAAADRGWMDLHNAMHETTIALRRAGASMIITYFARQLALDLSGRSLQEAARV